MLRSLILTLMAVPLLAAAAPGWKTHSVEQGDGHGHWLARPARKQLLHHDPPGRYTMGFGVAQTDNRQIVLVGSWNDGRSENAYESEWCGVAFSSDRGAHWSPFEAIPGVIGRPMMFTDLGAGHLAFQVDPLGPYPHGAVIARQYFSSDYGRTWPERRLLQKAANNGTIDGAGDEGIYATEGNPLVDRDASGRAVRVAQIGWNIEKGKAGWPEQPTNGILRWSRDGGRTWYGETQPAVWQRAIVYRGQTYHRGTDEGSLVRAANGWLVAALRLNLPPRFIPEKNDNLEGTGISISRDDGRTWSPIRVLYDAGRHHGNLLRLPNGDLLLTLIVRNDIEIGGLRQSSYREGCEAILSHDNGLTWDLGHKFIVDSFFYHDPENWCSSQCGHLSSCLLDTGEVLTAYSNYAAQSIVLVRWNPAGGK